MRRMAGKMREPGFEIGRHRAGVADAPARASGRPKAPPSPDDRQPAFHAGYAERAGQVIRGERAEADVWAGDITRLRTLEGWFHLAALMDPHSRRVVGWAMDRTMKADLVKAALAMAIGRRRPGPGLIYHSDRGSQCASEAYQRELARNGMECGMSRKGDCWDNAVVERFLPKPEKRMREPQTVPHPKRG